MARNTRSARSLVDEWIATLRHVRPSAVVVVHDGGESPIAIRTGATRWQHAARTALKLAREHDGRVELRDEVGGVVSVLTLDDDDDDAPEESPDETADGVSVSLGQSDARLLGVLIGAQRMVLSEQRELLEPLLQGYTNLAGAFAQYAAQVVEIVKLAARVSQPPEDTSATDDLMRQVMGSLVPPLASKDAATPEASAEKKKGEA
jgi:hypothetical protein